MSQLRIAELDECPSCHSTWSYFTTSGRRCTRLVGIYDRFLDRTVAWHCPDCGAEWERGAYASDEQAATCIRRWKPSRR